MAFLEKVTKYGSGYVGNEDIERNNLIKTLF